MPYSDKRLSPTSFLVLPVILWAGSKEVHVCEDKMVAEPTAVRRLPGTLAEGLEAEVVYWQ